jgi:hypothetical protein
MNVSFKEIEDCIHKEPWAYICYCHHAQGPLTKEEVVYMYYKYKENYDSR